jgi:hypothetical protein
LVTNPKQLVAAFRAERASIPILDRCSEREPLLDMSASSSPELRKLTEYQQVCQSFVAGEMMLFTDMPKDDEDAKLRATKLAAQLLEFKKAGVKPLIMVEPVSDWGLIDFKEFDSGFYDVWLKTYFKTLKASGLTTADLGTWTPFPEANLPYWNNLSATPADFANVVNRYLRLLNAEFPGVEGSVLLNSATYETTDFEWANGEYSSLRTYVAGLDKTLVSSFGLQGFSWMPANGQQGAGIFDAGEYLNHRLAMEAADILGTKKVWYNTGSFGAKYTLDPERMVTLSPAKRQDVLNAIVEEMLKLKEKGYDVRINLFAEDKSELTEATDWSYWDSSTLSASPDASVFVGLMRRLNQEQIALSLFDRAK